MKKILLFVFLFTIISADQNRGLLMDQNISNEPELSAYVLKKVLPNGLTVLVRPVHFPKVSIQMWYNVGSKDEVSGEKGIAHLIEHMIFKGSDLLSESDINDLVHKLSGGLNAFTSFDYTGYKFDLPVQNWKEILPVIAECMTNCSFKDDHLNSEMKAVIQELKMRRDNFAVSLVEKMLGSIFPDHPYHYPVIGFKQDLWSVNSKDLKKFYKKHYLPNNATLIVVGDVDPEEVFALAEKYFGNIPANLGYQKKQNYFNNDILSQSVTIYRDIKQPLVLFSFIVPGSSEKKDNILDLITYVLGSGKAARLNRKLVDELKLVTSLGAFNWALFDHGLFFIMFEPKKISDIPLIKEIIFNEINDIVNNGLSEDELQRAIKKSQMDYYRLLENIDKQAYEIGKSYLATGDENYVFHYLDQPKDVLHAQIRELLKKYFRSAIMHEGVVLPLPKQEEFEWKKLQKESDKLDNDILSARIRESEVEPASYANSIKPKKVTEFNYPKAENFTLSNGLKVLTHSNENTPKIDLIIDFQAKHYYDPNELCGLTSFVSRMLNEGTKNYSASEFADALESRGMSLSSFPGGLSLSVLKEDLPKGLELLEEVLTNASFDEHEIEKVREQLLAGIKNFWDEPKQFAGQLIKEKIYKDHPYCKNPIGTIEGLQKIKRDDLLHYYKKYINPHGARMAIVGDLKDYNLKEVLEKGLSKWKGKPEPKISFPSLKKQKPEEINFPINRDQIVLSFAGLSLNRKNPDYDKLSIFNQILGSGSLSSMSSRLFQLREKTGLFYVIDGTLTANSDEEPGLVLVRTIVSKDNVKKAEDLIKDTLRHVTDSVTEEEFELAKQAILNSMISNFESNNNIGRALLFLDRFGFPSDYFDKRGNALEKISIAQMKEAVKKYLQPDEFITVRVGRVEDSKEKKTIK